MAAYAARGNMHSLVLIPEGKISWGKLSQALDYGALTCQLRTDFDGCVRILNELVRQKPVYLLNSVNPYRIEGQKTAAIELWSNSRGSRRTTSSSPEAISETVRRSARRSSKCVSSN